MSLSIPNLERCPETAREEIENLLGHFDILSFLSNLDSHDPRFPTRIDQSATLRQREK